MARGRGREKVGCVEYIHGYMGIDNGMQEPPSPWKPDQETKSSFLMYFLEVQAIEQMGAKMVTGRFVTAG